MERPPQLDNRAFREALRVIHAGRVANITLMGASDCRFCWQPIVAHVPVNVVELNDGNLIHIECAEPMAQVALEERQAWDRDWERSNDV